MFSLLRERKGTVCRAGLDRRVQSKCLVAELLSREQKVAHIVVVSFPLHQIKTFFFCFSGRPGPQLLNPCRRVKMRRLQLQVKKKQTKSTTKKKESGVSVLDILKHQQQQTEQNLVFLWSRTNKAEWLTVRLRPHPTSPTAVLKAVAFTNLNGS